MDAEAELTYTERMERLGGEFLGKLYELSGGDWHLELQLKGDWRRSGLGPGPRPGPH